MHVARRMVSADRFITEQAEDGLLVARHDGYRLFMMSGSAQFVWD
jgi:hypothetical protein